MGAGYLSLAYLVEISIVFNLAYAELKKDRFLKAANEKIEELSTTIDSTAVKTVKGKGDKKHNLIVEEFVDIKMRVNKLRAETYPERLSAWKAKIKPRSGGNEVTKHFKFSCWYFGLIKAEKDHFIAEYCLCISTITLLILTILHFLGANYYKDFVWLVFATLLTITTFFPAILVICGRLVQVSLIKIVAFAKEEHSQIATKNILQNIPAEEL